MRLQRVLQVVTIAALTLLVTWGAIDPPGTALNNAPLTRRFRLLSGCNALK